MRFKEWSMVLTAMVTLLAFAGTALVWAGDQRWVTGKQIGMQLEQIEATQQKQLTRIEVTQKKQLEQIEVNQLDREITFLQIKINQGEATNSDRIYVETLRQQLRALRGRLAQ